VFDTHCHLSFDCFEGRVESVLADALAAGVRGVITVSTTTRDALRLVELTEEHENVWCSTGVHPLYSDQPIDWEAMHTAAKHPKCVAWGELGLDNHYDKPDAARQRRVLQEQLERIEAWSDEGLRKPVIIHCRDAYQELLPLLDQSSLPNDRFVFHCFTGTTDDAKRVLAFGGWISFTGIVTFVNASAVADASDLVPLDRLMVETDAPFLTPEPHRSTRPNEPKFVPHVAAFLAERRGMSTEAFEAATDANAERFFGIG
jgi:TatD DNase family protein